MRFRNFTGALHDESFGGVKCGVVGASCSDMRETDACDLGAVIQITPSLFQKLGGSGVINQRRRHVARA